MVVVSPLFPPARGGLADHTHRLARSLAQHRPVRVLTTRGASPEPNIEVFDPITNWHRLSELETALDDCPAESPILWQYVPHMYGRGGINIALLRQLRRFQRRGRHQILIAHEIKAPLHWKPSRLIYALWHRFAWQSIRQSIPIIGISTEAWLQSWPSDWDHTKNDFFVLPSPSNVSLVQTRPDHRRVWREKLGLKSNAPVLGYFGTWGASKQPEWIFAAWRHARATGIPAVLVLLGGDPPQNISEDERPFFRSLGYIPEVEVSLALQAFDLLLLPFEDGVSERRTSFTAGLSHGTPILTTVGHGTGTTLRSARFIASIPVNSPSDYPLEAVRLLGDPNRLSKLASDSIQAYHQSFSWEIVTKRLLKRLRSRPPNPGMEEMETSGHQDR